MITEYLKKLGLTDKEQRIYLALAEIGVQPASVIAQRCKFDRVTTYKHLKKMASLGLVKVYMDRSIQSFGIENFDALKSILIEREKDVQDMLAQFQIIESLLAATGESEAGFVPKLQLFEGEAGVRRCFHDLLFEAKEQGIKKIRMLTTNTFEERLGDVPLSRYVGELFEDLKQKGISIQAYEASGTLVPERISALAATKLNPEKLPAARGSTNIFVVGQAVYITCYRSSQIALKIRHSEISQIFHFLFDLMGKQK